MIPRSPPGGDVAGKHIYKRGSENGKKVQCNMGAKNHGVIMPDANREYTVNQLVGAAFGAAGQVYLFSKHLEHFSAFTNKTCIKGMKSLAMATWKNHEF